MSNDKVRKRKPKKPKDISMIRTRTQWINGNWKNASPHKAKYYYANESLEKIAKEQSGKSTKDPKHPTFVNNITWEDIANLNFGTKINEEINYYLGKFNKCTKVTQDGYNYCLSSNDEEPWLWLPTVQNLQVTSSGKQAISEVLIKRKYDQVRWNLGKGVQEVYSKSYSEQVLGVAFNKNMNIEIELRLTKDVLVKAGTKIDLEVAKDQSGFIQHSFTVVRQEKRLVYLAVTFNDINLILRELKSRLHWTFIRCYIPGDLSPNGRRITSLNLLYPTLQHSLFFLPGVFGSEIWVENEKGAQEEAWPEIGLAGDVELELLVCKPDGTPHRVPNPNKLRVLDNVLHLRDVYSFNGILENVNRLQFPEIYLEASKIEPINHIIFTGVPYDWRLNIRESYKIIAEEINSKHNALVKNVSKYPFISQNISIAGHSTGGVIMRGIATMDNVIRDKVDHMFFINVPHWGAPKAEFVFLTGDMLPIISNESMRQLAPDMPIVYFLSPSIRYGKEVSYDWSPNAKKDRINAAISAGAYNTQKKALYGHRQYRNEGILRFNTVISQLAENYSISTQNSRPNPNLRAFVFHSGGHPTIVGTRIVGTKVEKIESRVGDETVPTISQVADIGSWPNAVLFKPTEGNPKHVPAPNSEWLWTQIARIYCLDKNFRKQTIRWPKNSVDFRRLLVTLAISAWPSEGAVQKEPFGKTYKLNKGQVTIFEHKDVDYGLGLVECLCGNIEVNFMSGVWKDNEYVTKVALGKNQYYFHEFKGLHAVDDQDNLIKVISIDDSEYRLDFVSVNY